MSTSLNPHHVTNTEIHNCLTCRQEETVGCSALTETSFPPNPQRFRDHWERDARKSHRQWLSAVEKYLLDMAETLHIWTPSSCDSMHWICTRSSQPKPLPRQELLAPDGCRKGQSQFSSGIWPLRGYSSSRGLSYMFYMHACIYR